MTETQALSAIPQPGLFPEWPEFKGVFHRMTLKRGRMGLVATIKVRCDSEIFSAFTFNPRLIRTFEIIAKRTRLIDGKPSIWLKGPIEEIEELGRKHDRMRIVYFDDQTDYPRGIPLAPFET